jgi:hypothetical protein
MKFLTAEQTQEAMPDLFPNDGTPREYQEALQEIRSAISQAMNGSRFARYHPNSDVEIVLQLREGKLLSRIVIRQEMDLSSIKP